MPFRDKNSGAGGVDAVAVQALIDATIDGLTGQIVGSASTFAGLPQVDSDGVAVSLGDLVLLDTEDGANVQGFYRWDGSAYVLFRDLTSKSDSNVAYASDSSFSSVYASVLPSGVTVEDFLAQDSNNILFTRIDSLTTVADLTSATSTTQVAVQDLDNVITTYDSPADDAIEIDFGFYGVVITGSIVGLRTFNEFKSGLRTQDITGGGTWDAKLGQFANLANVGTGSVVNPVSNPVDGEIYFLNINQQTGFTAYVSFDAAYKYSDGVSIGDVSTRGGALSLSFQYNESASDFVLCNVTQEINETTSNGLSDGSSIVVDNAGGNLYTIQPALSASTITIDAPQPSLYRSIRGNKFLFTFFLKASTDVATTYQFNAYWKTRDGATHPDVVVEAGQSKYVHFYISSTEATSTENDTVEGELVATKIDSSGAATVETLAASTNLGIVRLFTNINVTNTASLAVASGETLNGVVDGTFLFSNYTAGTQFRADEVSGGWVVSVVGASSNSEFEIINASISDITGISGSTFVTGAVSSGEARIDAVRYYDSGDFRYIQVDISDFDDTEVIYQIEPSIMPSGGEVLSAYQLGRSGAGDGGNYVTGAVSGQVNQFFYDRNNSIDVVHEITVEVKVTNPIAQGSVVLAGMVEPEILSYLIAKPSSDQAIDTLDATDNMPFSDTVSSVGGGITNNGDGSFTLTSGTYKLSSQVALTSDGGDITNPNFRWFNITTGSFIGSQSYYVDFTGDSSPKPVDALAILDVSVDTDIALRPSVNVDNNISNFQQESHISIEQLPYSTVVLPQGLTPENLSFGTAYLDAGSGTVTQCPIDQLTTESEGLTASGSGFTIDRAGRYHLTPHASIVSATQDIQLKVDGTTVYTFNDDGNNTKGSGVTVNVNAGALITLETDTAGVWANENVGSLAEDANASRVIVLPVPTSTVMMPDYLEVENLGEAYYLVGSYDAGRVTVSDSTVNIATGIDLTNADRVEITFSATSSSKQVTGIIDLSDFDFSSSSAGTLIWDDGINMDVTILTANLVSGTIGLLTATGATFEIIKFEVFQLKTAKEVVMPESLEVEDLEVDIFSQQLGLTGSNTYSLDSSITWDDVKSTYASIRIETQMNVTSVGLVEQSFDIPVSKIILNSRVRPEYGAALFNLIFQASNTGDFIVPADFSTLTDYGIRIVGVKPQKTVINTVDVDYSIQEISGVYIQDFGNIRKMWGIATGGNVETVNFPLPFASNPHVIATAEDSTSSAMAVNNITTTSVELRRNGGSATHWEAKGIKP